MKNSIMIIAMAAIVLIAACSPQATVIEPAPSGGDWAKSPQTPLLKEGRFVPLAWRPTYG